MALIRREAAIAAIQAIEEQYEREEDMDCAEAVMSARWAVQEVSIEKVPLRCNECSFYLESKHDWGDYRRCKMLNREVRETDYCSFGAWTGVRE